MLVMVLLVLSALASYNPLMPHTKALSLQRTTISLRT